MCPLHADHDLRHLDPIEQNGVKHNGIGRTHRVRRPKVVKLVEPALRRGFQNNGLIEVASEASDSELDFEDEEMPDGTVYKLPAIGIKLDFIDKVKRYSSVLINVCTHTDTFTANESQPLKACKPKPPNLSCAQLI